VGAHAATLTNLVRGAGAILGFGALAEHLQGKRKREPKPREASSGPCPADKRRFFDWLNDPLGKMAKELDTTKELLFMQAAKEGGWTMSDLDHNQPLNNPFGVNQIKNRKAAGNVRYSSLDDAIEYWKGKYGDRVRGTRTAEEFARGMQHPTNGQPYNTNPKYEGILKGLYPSVLKFMRLCGIQ
jgi:hypothetical protein